MKKFFVFVINWFVCFALLLALLYILFNKSAGLVLLYTPYVVLLVSFLGVCIYSIWYHNLFEKFLVYITYTSSLFLFIILVPIVIERSLSSFVYFYTVENGYFEDNFINDNYMRRFAHKRLDDGIKGGFLIYDKGTYKPTLKTKIFYNILYPLGYITGTLKNYETFKQEINHSQDNEGELR